jgi:hypothetical protein
MVSLIERYNYHQRINESPKLVSFYNLLFDREVVESSQAETTGSFDELYFGVISALRRNDKATFEKLLALKSKSRPSKDSIMPFINDDFLVFSFVCGIMKYRLDKDWITYILSIRMQNAITMTFKNILAGDLYSKASIPEIFIVYLKLVQPDTINDVHLTNAYKSVTNDVNVLLGSQNDFRIICAIRAYDLIVLERRPFDGDTATKLKIFQNRFLRRTKFIGWSLQLVFLVSLLWGLSKLPYYSSETINYLNENGYIFTILGALGITFLTNQINWVKDQTHTMVMRLLGYPKELIKKNRYIP